MKMTCRSLTLAFIGLLSLTAANLSAQSLAVYPKWTLEKRDFYKSTYDPNTGVYVDKVAKYRVTAQDILNLLEDSYHTNFPYGANLVLVDYSYFQVQAVDGSVVVADVSPFLTYMDTYSQTNYLYKGKEDTVKGTLNYTYTLNSVIQFDDPSQGISFNYSGLMNEKYSQSAQDKYGYRKYQDSMKINGMGYGEDADGFLTLSGKANSSKAVWYDF